MTSEKISIEQFNDYVQKKINKFLEDSDYDKPNRMAIECGLYKAWVEILAEQDPTEIAERLGFIRTEYFLVKKTKSKRAEIVDSGISKSIIEYKQAVLHRDCFITQKIEFRPI